MSILPTTPRCCVETACRLKQGRNRPEGRFLFLQATGLPSEAHVAQLPVGAGQPLELRLQPGYDHSYYFIASFIGEHIAHHARALA